MGLDSYWMKNDEPFHLDFEPELNLIGGMLSGNGNGSFRGKAYDGLIERISGISLYQEDMPNSEVKQIANAFEYTDTDVMRQYLKDEWGGMEEEDYNQQITDLTRMFRAYADAGATLHGWW